MLRFRAFASLLAGFGLAAGGTASCGGSESEPETPATIVPIQTAVPSAAPQPTTAPQPAASATASPLAAVEPALAQAAQAVLNELAKTAAPGAKPVGETKVGLLATNQPSEMLIDLDPGKCYTIVAAGLPPVAELNVQLLPATAVPGVQAVLAQDQGTGPQAILGKAPNCYKWALPIAGPVRVVTTVAAGQGLVATQVYVK